MLVWARERDGHVVLHNRKTGKQHVRAVEHIGLTLSADGSTLLTRQRDGSALVWSVADVIARGPELAPTKVPTANEDSFAERLPKGSARLGSTPFLYPAGISSIAFTRDGKGFVLGPETRNRTVPLCLYDVATGKEIRRFGTAEHDRALVAISPDGQTLAVRSRDSLDLWNVASGTLIKRLPAIRADGSVLAFSADGEFVVT